MKRTLYLLCLLCMAGCATSRMVPVESQAVDATFAASEEDLFYTAQRIFVQEGYLLDSTQKSTGTISTEPQRIAWRADQVSCAGMRKETGEAMLQVSFSARVQQHTLTLWTHMQAESEVAGRAASCASSGAIEREMMEKISAAIGA